MWSWQKVEKKTKRLYMDGSGIELLNNRSGMFKLLVAIIILDIFMYCLPFLLMVLTQ
jgi:hypothetical protein